MAKRQITALQVLRALAAFGVVCHHAFRAVTVHRPPAMALPLPLLLGNPTLNEVGSCGVDIFFVLSGFIMVYISDRYKRGSPVSDFISRRLIRIWPLYFLLTAVACLPLLWEWMRQRALPYDLQLFRLASFFFVPSFDEKGALQPIVGVGWTLNYEMLFYLSFAAALWLARRFIVQFLITVFALLFFIGLRLPASTPAGAFLSNNIVFEFLFGAAIAEWSLDRKIPRWPLLWIVLAIAGFTIAASSPNNFGCRALVRGLPATLILLGALQLEGKMRWPAWAVLFGDTSYSTYLIHVRVIFYINTVLFPVFYFLVPPIASEVTALLAIIASHLAGYVCYRWVETPLLSYFHGLYGTGEAAGAKKFRQSNEKRAKS